MLRWPYFGWEFGCDSAKARFLRVILDHLYVDPFYGTARGFLVTAICLPRKSVGMFILFFLSYIDSIRSFKDLIAGWLSDLVQPNFGVMIEDARIRLNGWQRAVVAVGSAFCALLDPRRADLIAALGETTGKPPFERVLDRMKRTPEGRAVLLERPRVLSSKVGHAWDLPENTFGGAYARFMGSRNFSPDDRPPIRFMDTEELAYVAMRAREVHDFWHTLFNLPTNLIGESALKVIEFEQMYLPMCMLSVVGGSARFNEKQRALFFKHYFPWAVKAGVSCTDLMCIYYEHHFAEDLVDVRRRWGIVPAPSPPKHTTA